MTSRGNFHHGFIPAVLALACLGGGLAAVLYHLNDRGDGREDLTEAGLSLMPVPAPRGAPPDIADPTGVQVATILARPLFDPHRRPPALGEGATGEGLPRLAGILVGSFGRSAIFANPTGGRPLVVAEGGRIDVYIVQSIRPGEAIVLGPAGRRVLRPAFEPDTASTHTPHDMASR